eukprot:scaffold188677_cov19-Prasinocladus_malaysianus.AAC.1
MSKGYDITVLVVATSSDYRMSSSSRAQSSEADRFNRSRINSSSRDDYSYPRSPTRSCSGTLFCEGPGQCLI